MNISTSRLLSLIAIGLIVFGMAAFLLLQVMPSPMRPFDYLVTGAVATLMSLLVIWLLLMREMGAAKELLFNRRSKAPEQAESQDR